MKRLLPLLCLLSGHAMACSVTLHWTRPAKNTDGSAFTDLDVYRVYRGSSASTLVLYATLAPYLQELTDAVTTAPMVYAVVAVDSAGVESDLSNTLIIASTTCPRAATGMAAH